MSHPSNDQHRYLSTLSCRLPSDRPLCPIPSDCPLASGCPHVLPPHAVRILDTADAALRPVSIDALITRLHQEPPWYVCAEGRTMLAMLDYYTKRGKVRALLSSVKTC
eukprot:m.122887 g.122887  ORF g.122887 m.122887 type:complete len:108 (+) comp9316_c0_seq1:1881-2204(+)